MFVSQLKRGFEATLPSRERVYCHGVESEIEISSSDRRVCLVYVIELIVYYRRKPMTMYFLEQLSCPLWANFQNCLAPELYGTYCQAGLFEQIDCLVSQFPWSAIVDIDSENYSARVGSRRLEDSFFERYLAVLPQFGLGPFGIQPSSWLRFSRDTRFGGALNP